MRSAQRQAPTTLFLVTLSLLSAPALSGCATRVIKIPPQAIAAPVPEELRHPCPRARVQPLQTVKDNAALVLREEDMVNSCEKERDRAVSIIDTLNAALQALQRAESPKPWWRYW